jgi:hypothetical protein
VRVRLTEINIFTNVSVTSTDVANYQNIVPLVVSRLHGEMAVDFLQGLVIAAKNIGSCHCPGW